MNGNDTPNTSPPARSRRGGRKPLELSQLRTHRLDVDLSPAELHELKARAVTASLPLRAWARQTLLRGKQPAPTVPSDLRRLWSESSTLQSSMNQSCRALNELRISGDLTLTNPRTVEILAELYNWAPSTLELVRALRLEMLSWRTRR